MESNPSSDRFAEADQSGAGGSVSPPELEPAASPARPARTILKRIAQVVGGIVLLIFLAWLILYITKGRFLKGTFEKYVSSSSEREVKVAGDFQLYFAPFNVKFYAEGLSVANPAWAREKTFFSARKIDTRIRTMSLIFGDKRQVNWLVLEGGRVAAEWDAKHVRNSWTFGDPNKPAEPFELPLIKSAIVDKTRVTYNDPLFQLNVDVGIETVRATANNIDNAIRFSGGGNLRNRPFTLTGSLLSPNETVRMGRNKLRMSARSADTALDVSGTLPGATEIEGADLKIAVRGGNIARLFDFLGVAVPDTRAYRLTSNLTRKDEIWRFTRLKGVFGDSDLAGQFTVAMPANRLKLDADLVTNTLDIVDAGPWIGYDPARLDARGGAGAIETVGGTPRVLPDAPLRTEAIARFDAHLDYKIRRVRAESFPISDIGLTLDLNRSLLKLSPLTFAMAGGRVSSDILINARRRPVFTEYDIRLSPTPMGRLLARWGVEESGTTGMIKARVAMSGSGDSIRESLATSNGRIAIIIPKGTFWTRNVQLAELDIGTFVQKMFEKKLKEPVQINCGLIGFTVRNGIAAADPILIDTKKSVMLGRGGFSFKNESMDILYRADGKKFSVFSAQSPIGIGGHFAAPKIDVISPELIARGAGGLGLAIVASPLAGVLAFVDVGDAKGTQCGPVLAGANAKAQRTTKGKPRDDVGRGTTATAESGKKNKQESKEQKKKFLGIF